MDGAVGGGTKRVSLKLGRIAVADHLARIVDRQCDTRGTAECAQVIGRAVDRAATGGGSECMGIAGPKTTEDTRHLAGVIDTVSLAIAAEGNNAGVHSKSLQLMRLNSTTIASHLARAVDRPGSGRWD